MDTLQKRWLSPHENRVLKKIALTNRKLVTHRRPKKILHHKCLKCWHGILDEWQVQEKKLYLFDSEFLGSSPTHYSKSQIFVQKFNLDKTLQFFSENQSCQQLKSGNPKHFHEFFDQFFLTIFLVKSKLSTAKKSQTAAFSWVFT